jgi:hypothetical protein
MQICTGLTGLYKGLVILFIGQSLSEGVCYAQIVGLIAACFPANLRATAVSGAGVHLTDGHLTDGHASAWHPSPILKVLAPVGQIIRPPGPPTLCGFCRTLTWADIHHHCR